MSYHNLYFIEPHEDETGEEEETAVESAENEEAEQGEYQLYYLHVYAAMEIPKHKFS